MARVPTTGRPSGTAATASASAVCTRSPSGMPCAYETAATSAATPSAAAASRRPSCASRRSRGVSLSITLPARTPIRPTSVAMPVAVTSARARPATTVVALYTMVTRSARTTSGSTAAEASLSAGADSPVRSASTVRSSAASSSRASAGTRCPASSRMTSPGTRRRASSSASAPSRSTCASATSRATSASIARRARSSVANPMATLSASTAAIAAASSGSPVRSATPAAAARSRTMMLRNCARKISQAEAGGVRWKWLGPYRRRRSAASGVSRPDALDPRRARASEGGRACQVGAVMGLKMAPPAGTRGSSGRGCRTYEATFMAPKPALHAAAPRLRACPR